MWTAEAKKFIFPDGIIIFQDTWKENNNHPGDDYKETAVNIWILQDSSISSTAFHRNAIVRPNKPGAKKSV